MQIDRLVACALGLGALGCLLIACEAIGRIAAARRGARALEQALDRRAAGASLATSASLSGAVPQARYMVPAGAEPRRDAGGAHQQPAAKPPATFAGRLAAWRARCGQAGARWLETPLGKQVVAAEDRRLLEQCGFVDVDARGFFLLSRVVCALSAPPLAIWLWGAHVPSAYRMVFVVATFTLGFMLPKRLLGRRAAMRRGAVADEMPVLVDLLRLLQGVGLSLDQSLQVMVGDFRAMLPVLAGELELAQRQFAAGRTREQSLQRLATSFDNEDLRAVVRLMIQVDRHGGAVQEPLKQFGDRLREARRARLREKIGQLTVKMTGVMVVTLLPALLIVTAGPGLLAVIRSLAVHR